MTKEFTGMLCNFYMVALTVLLPLYTQGSYVMLGDSKYALFRNVSLLCLCLAGVSLLVGGLKHISGIGGRLSAWTVRWKEKRVDGRQFLSPVDICVLCYGACVVVSALCSSYGATAWTGYREWHMGAVSQLIFVSIYFLFSRWYTGSAWTVYLWEAAFFLVVLLGFCSRLGLDPLKLLDGFDSGDWGYSHLISTIGNINWFCGYCAVALAMPVAGYLRGKGWKNQILLYIVSVLGLILLCIQGSDAGPALAATCLGVCLLWSGGNASTLGKTLLLAAGVFLGLPCYSWFVELLGDAARKAIPEDGLGLSVFGWGGWWLVGLACVGLWFMVHKLAGVDSHEKDVPSSDFEGIGHVNLQDASVRKDASVRSDVSVQRDTSIQRNAVVKRFWLGTVILVAAVVTVVGALYLVQLTHTQDWVNGRASLWRLAWQGFLRGDWKQKLLGVGPDCFAEYIYSVFPPEELPEVEGHFADAVFTNAHNQWLNHLVNTGLLGLCSVAGLAVTTFRRYRHYLPGVLALSMYGVNSLVSFQQVLSTPMFFLMLGICEYSARKNKVK